MKIENMRYKGVTLNSLTAPKVKPETFIIMEQRVLQMSPAEYFFSRSAMERDCKFLHRYATCNIKLLTTST